MAMRWRCPPDSDEPRGPAGVFSPKGSPSANSETCAASTAACSCASVTLVPSTMFSRRVSSNSAESWLTVENWSRSVVRSNCCTGTSPRLTVPESASTIRVSRLKMVDFPAPDGPTSAVVSPARAVKLSPRSTGWPS